MTETIQPVKDLNPSELADEFRSRHPDHDVNALHMLSVLSSSNTAARWALEQLVEITRAKEQLHTLCQRSVDEQLETVRKLENLHYIADTLQKAPRWVQGLVFNSPHQAPCPTIVCLCGSTRFSKAFQRANLEETLAGKIVLSIGCDMRSDAELFAGESEEELTKIKAALDELHKRKIDLADEVLILNVGGYIGDSTASELRYAEQLGKTVRFLETPAVCSNCAATIAPYRPTPDEEVKTHCFCNDDCAEEHHQALIDKKR